MTKNPILFIVDANNDFLRYEGVIKALQGYREEVVFISPNLLTDFVSVSMMPNNANYNRYEQYVKPTSEKAQDYLAVDDALYQTCFDWHVFRIEIKEQALQEFSAFRSGDVSFAFAIQQISRSSKCVVYKGVFGVDNPLPTSNNTIGDYFECEDYDYSIVSGTTTYNFSKGMLAYWNGTRWVKDRLITKGATSSVNISVEPSHAVGYELEDDEVNTVESVLSEVAQAELDIIAINSEIDGLRDGTEAFDEITLKDISNNQTSITYASKVADDLELDRLELEKADITYVDAQDNVLDAKIGALDLDLQGQITANGDDIQDIINANPLVNFTVEGTTWVITITKYDGTQVQYDLPLETMVVDAYYDEANKDLVLELQNGNLVSIPVDDIFNGLATQDWVNLQLANYYTEAEADILLNTKVDKVLTPYDELLHSNASGNELVYVYMPSTNQVRKMTLDEIYSGANTATGAFVSSATYTDLTSGASIMVLVHDLTLQSSGDYRVDLKSLTRDKLVFVKFPDTSANQNLLRVSLNNGTTYYNVVKNGGRFRASVVSNQLVRLEFDGTRFIADIQGDVEVLETYSNRISSTFGKFNPINDGMPIVKEIQGRTIPALENLVTNGDFAVDTNADGLADNWVKRVVYTSSLSNGVQRITYGTATNNFIDIGQSYSFTVDNVYYIKANFYSTLSVKSVVIRNNAIDGAIIHNINYVDGISFKALANASFLTFYSQTTPISTSYIELSKVGIFNLTASHGVTSTSGTAYDNAVADIEAMLEANGGYITTTPTTHVENSEFKSVGKNLFDKLATRNLGVGISVSTGATFVNATLDSTDYIEIQPNTPYKYTPLKYGAYYDSNKVFISSVTDGSNSPSNAKYVRYTIDKVSIDTFQLEQGTVATPYAPYNTETQKFNHARLSKLPNGVSDKIRYHNGAYVLDRYVQEYTLLSADMTALVTTATNYDSVGIPTSKLVGSVAFSGSIDLTISVNGFGPDISDTSFNADNIANVGRMYVNQTFVNLIVPKGTYANLGEAQADLTGTKIWYQLATPLLATEVIDVDGTLIQESTTTVEQLQNIPTSVNIEYAMNIEQTTKTLVERDKLQQLEIDNLEVDVATRQLRLGGITASRPTTPSLYQMYFDTTLNVPIWWNGTNWVNHAGTTV